MVIVLVGEIEAVEYFSITISFLIAKKEPRLSTMIVQFLMPEVDETGVSYAR